MIRQSVILVSSALLYAVASDIRLQSATRNLRRRSSAKPVDSQWQDMSCFMDLGKYGIQAGPESIVFQAGHASDSDGVPEVLVVQDSDVASSAPRRTLVFKSARGKCNPQAGTTCTKITKISAAESGLADSVGNLMDEDGENSIDLCEKQICTSDLKPLFQGEGYVQSMVGAMSFLQVEPTRILSIGLGAGSLALALQDLYPNSQHVVVELSNQVVQAAKCFGADSSANLDIVNADGCSYLEEAKNNEFDAVLIDVFDSDDKVPPCFTTEHFFSVVHQKLTLGGVIAMNAHTGKTLHNDLADVLPTMRKSFIDVQVGRAPGLANAIIVGSARSSTSAAHSDTKGCNSAKLKQVEAWCTAAEFTSKDDF
mmetsp:Transcript_125093/g.198151  ORF Transcript_125093/g.198151 Transcript_125093/m.198151 type:complete len:368 (-) Transcript_125093:35-1138(-)